MSDACLDNIFDKMLLAVFKYIRSVRTRLNPYAAVEVTVKCYLRVV